MLLKEILLLCMVCIATRAQASSDDRFIKKYAMMKIYESCFGPEVVKQIRQEMKDAYTKCSAPSFEPPPNQYQPGQGVPMVPPVLLGKLPPGFAIDPNTQTITKPGDNSQIPENDIQNQNQDSQGHQKLPGILAFRPHSPQFGQQHQQAVPPYMMPGANTQFRPYSQATPFYQFPYAMPNSYYSQNLQYNPYGQYPSPYQQQPYYQQPYFSSHRMSRDMDLRERLDLISKGTSAGGKVRNITCVMQELGYIDHNLEPNYEKITERISNLPVSSELKGDIQDGLQFCQKFSQCVPDVKRDVAPLSHELVKPMFFFRCYKHKKLEACIMKDIRERFTSEDELDTDTDFRSLSRSGRSIREDLGDPRFDALDEMAVYLYDFLSGSNTFDFDLYM